MRIKLVNKNNMRSINPKCTNNESFKYSVLISLHYDNLKHHPEKIKQLKSYEKKHISKSNDSIAFKNNNPSVSLNACDEYGDLLHKTTYSTNNNAYLLKINNNRYDALKPNKNISY